MINNNDEPVIILNPINYFNHLDDVKNKKEVNNFKLGKVICKDSKFSFSSKNSRRNEHNSNSLNSLYGLNGQNSLNTLNTNSNECINYYS